MLSSIDYIRPLLSSFRIAIEHINNTTHHKLTAQIIRVASQMLLTLRDNYAVTLITIRYTTGVT